MDRRSILKGALALTAVAIPATAVAAQSKTERLWPELQRRLRAFELADAALDVAEAKFKEMCPVRPKEVYANQFYWCDARWLVDGEGRHYGGPEQWRVVLHKSSNLPHVLPDVERRLAAAEAFEARRDEIKESLNLNALGHAYDAAFSALWDLDEEILAAPSVSLSDVMKKIEIVRRREVDELDDHNNRFTLDVFADIERLAAST
ncbi:hypothetical protein [Aquabacter sp. CN5-332]|uniref:hypothetical protein n=1 Tax=Aquabacter sp. CN5-332 TaxID=3156608 RepID=UPI0032B5CE3C